MVHIGRAHDALLRLRLNEPAIGTIIVRTTGDAGAALLRNWVRSL